MPMSPVFAVPQGCTRFFCPKYCPKYCSLEAGAYFLETLSVHSCSLLYPVLFRVAPCPFTGGLAWQKDTKAALMLAGGRQAFC